MTSTTTTIVFGMVLNCVLMGVIVYLKWTIRELGKDCDDLYTSYIKLKEHYYELLKELEERRVKNERLLSN